MSELGPFTRAEKAESEADTLAHEAAREAARADRAEQERDWALEHLAELEPHLFRPQAWLEEAA